MQPGPWAVGKQTNCRGFASQQDAAQRRQPDDCLASVMCFVGAHIGTSSLYSLRSRPVPANTPQQYMDTNGTCMPAHPQFETKTMGRSENARASAHAPQDYKYIKGSLVSTSAQVGGRRLGCRSGAGCSGGRVCEACWLSRHLRGSVAGKPALRSPFCAQIQRFGGITVPWPGGLSAESGCKSG